MFPQQAFSWSVFTPNHGYQSNYHSVRKHESATSKMGARTERGDPADGRLRPLMTD